MVATGVYHSPGIAVKKPFPQRRAIMAGFLIDVSSEPSSQSQFEAALSLHHSCHLSMNKPLIKIRDEHCQISCMDTNDYAYHLWTEQRHNDDNGSFVYILGWFYCIDADNGELTDNDFRQMLLRHSKGMPPIGAEFGGQYVVVIYDSCTRSIAVQPDRYSLSSVYFASSRNQVVISNRATAVASLSHAPFDGYSVLSMMRGTHPPFNRSLFSGVSRVMPGYYLFVDVDATRMEIRQAAPIYVPIWQGMLKESVDLLSEKIICVSRRVTRCKKPLCDLTGGNDTRVTAAAISHDIGNASEADITWVVAGAEDHPDVQIATRIAKMFNWRLLRLDRLLPTDAPLEELRDAAVYADGSALIDSAFCRVMRECSYRSQWDWHVGSIGGELLRDFFWSQEMLSLGRTSKVNYDSLLAYRLYASPSREISILGQDIPSIAMHDEVLLEPYHQIDREGGELPNPYKLDVMYLHKLCYSAGVGLSWLTGLQHIRCPLLSWEIISIALSLPWHWKTNRQMTLRLINQMSPLLSQIPNDAGAPMVPWGVTTWPTHTAFELKRIFRVMPRILRKLTGGSGGLVSPVVVQPPASWLDQLANSKHIDSFVDRRKINELLLCIKSSTRTADQRLAVYTLLTLDLLLGGVPNLRAKIEFGTSPKRG